jgi:hypothetical protein
MGRSASTVCLLLPTRAAWSWMICRRRRSTPPVRKFFGVFPVASDRNQPIMKRCSNADVPLLLLSVDLWSISTLIPGIPVLAIMVRYNLLNSGTVGPKAVQCILICLPACLPACMHHPAPRALYTACHSAGARVSSDCMLCASAPPHHAPPGVVPWSGGTVARHDVLLPRVAAGLLLQLVRAADDRHGQLGRAAGGVPRGAEALPTHHRRNQRHRAAAGGDRQSSVHNGTPPSAPCLCDT